MNVDLLYPLANLEAQKHKSKRLVGTPNTRFIEILCKCNGMTNTFTHAKSIVCCSKCKRTLLVPKSGKAKQTSEVSKIRALE
ncbi:Ribosomal protein S27 [Spironucleus salmonicida]|uniref:Ribosomal protein S27 n=1 Tax=Spironucleus salmonicida TaxID=348837 RepID=V6LIE5_9EUKA|nr:Ribosomal protein S27 [Spironucleus salmonicida]|eukprot:EST44312.1 Ribosomal protein S27 [Spironucleus salmonicida]